MANDTKDYSQYASHHSEKGFVDKVRTAAGKIGRGALYKVLQLYYVLDKTDVPAWAKATIMGALGYFVFPIDVVPDFLPVVGFADDLAAVSAALGTVSMYVDEDVNNKARKKLADLLG